MGFGWGIFIGIIVGVNVGLVLGAVLAASKRKESSQDLLWDQLHAEHSVMDQAVMDEPVAADTGPGRPMVSPPALASRPNAVSFQHTQDAGYPSSHA